MSGPKFPAIVRHIPRIYAGKQRRECDCANCSKTNDMDNRTYRKKDIKEKESYFGQFKKNYRPYKKETSDIWGCEEELEDHEFIEKRRVQLVEEVPQKVEAAKSESKINKKSRSKGCRCCGSKKRKVPEDAYMPRNKKQDKGNSEESEEDIKSQGKRKEKKKEKKKEKETPAQDTEYPKPIRKKKSTSSSSSSSSKEKYRRRFWEKYGATSEASKESAIDQPEKNKQTPKEEKRTEKPKSVKSTKSRSSLSSCCSKKGKGKRPKDIYMPRKQKSDVEPQTDTLSPTSSYQTINQKSKSELEIEAIIKKCEIKAEQVRSESPTKVSEERLRNLENQVSCLQEQLRLLLREKQETQSVLQTEKSQDSKQLYEVAGEPTIKVRTNDEQKDKEKNEKNQKIYAEWKAKKMNEKPNEKSKQMPRNLQNAQCIKRVRIEKYANGACYTNFDPKELPQPNNCIYKPHVGEIVEQSKNFYAIWPAREQSAMENAGTQKKVENKKADESQETPSRKMLSNAQLEKRTDKSTANENACPYCKDKQLSTVSQRLCLRVRNLVWEYRPREVVLNILLQADGLYHMNIAARKTGESVACLLATEDAVREAHAQGLFEKVLTLYVADGRDGGTGDAGILEKTFEYV